MKTEIDIDDYLSNDEKKQICIDHLKHLLKNNDERILYNMAYNVSFGLVDGLLTQEGLETIKNKVLDIIKNLSSYNVFRKKDYWEKEESPAYLEVLKSIEQHKHLINPIIKKAIEEHNYFDDLPPQDYIAETIIDALRKGLAI